MSTTSTRSLRRSRPDLPTVVEYLPGYEASAFFGLGAPGNTPAEIVERLNKEINMALSELKISSQFSGLGATVLRGSPADFGKLIADEIGEGAPSTSIISFSFRIANCKERERERETESGIAGIAAISFAHTE